MRHIFLLPIVLFLLGCGGGGSSGSSSGTSSSSSESAVTISREETLSEVQSNVPSPPGLSNSASGLTPQ